MTTRMLISVTQQGGNAGFALSFSTWRTEAGGISMPAKAELEELKPTGTNFARYRLNSWQYQEMEGVATVGCADYITARDLSDKCHVSIGRPCSVEHTFGSVKTRWNNAMILEAAPVIGSATVTDSATATAYLQCRFRIRRMPDG